MPHWARARAYGDIKQRISSLPAEQQKRFRRQMASVKKLSDLTTDIMVCSIDASYAIKKYRRRRTTANFRQFFTTLSKLHKEVSKVPPYLRKGDFPREGIPDLSGVQKQLFDVSLYILLAYDGDRRYLRKMLQKLAVLLDTLSDVLNKMIIELNQKTRAMEKKSKAR